MTPDEDAVSIPHDAVVAGARALYLDHRAGGGELHVRQHAEKWDAGRVDEETREDYYADAYTVLRAAAGAES